jgi:hypothetical protein
MSPVSLLAWPGEGEGGEGEEEEGGGGGNYKGKLSAYTT